MCIRDRGEEYLRYILLGSLFQIFGTGTVPLLRHNGGSVCALLPLVARIPERDGLKAGRHGAARSRWRVAGSCVAGAALVYVLLTAYTSFASTYGALPYACLLYTSRCV